MKNLFKLFSKQKTTDEKESECLNSDLYLRIESTKKYWTPELIEWVGNEKNPITLAVASCLLNTWTYPNFMPSNPGDYSNAHKDNPALSFFISDLCEMLETKCESICPKLHYKIRVTNYYEKFRG